MLHLYLFALLGPLGAAAADPGASTEARLLYLHGNYQEAIEKLETLKAPADDSRPQRLLARCLRAQGRYAQAEKLLTLAAAGSPNDPDLLAELADLDLFHGRYQPALAKAEAALAVRDTTLAARWVKARSLVATGQYDQANKEHEWFIHYYNAHQPTDSEALLLVAMAAAEYARWNKLPDEFDFILNELLADAAKDGDFWPAAWFAGALLLDKYNRSEGIPELQKALQINPNALEVHVALGTAAYQDYDFTTGYAHAGAALAVNPNDPAALRLKADLLFADGKTDLAVEQLEKALPWNPVSEETLGRLAACRQLQRQADKAEEIERRVLEQNPKPGVFYTHLADLLEKRRQFTLAEEYYRKAIAAANHLAGPRNGLGMLYMRIGKEDDARKVFEEARSLDPFHVRVLNMLKVLKHLEGYEVVKTPNYEVLVSPGKDKLLGQYAARFLEEQHAELCERFGYVPTAPARIEILVDHQWFSGRVVGLPGVGIVGACTGDVVAMASPRSLKTPFHWGRVLRHEVTHILTLRQTNYNISHWFTEALAVMAEGYPRPAIWDELLAERVPKRELFNLDNLNHAFVRPKSPLDWQMAYCQSLLYAEYMIAKYGKETIPALLAAYRDGVETDAAIPQVFKVDKAKFEAGYREFLERLVRDLKSGAPRRPKSFAEVERAWRSEPDNADRAAELAWHYQQRQSNLKARELAEKALALRPHHPLAAYVLAKLDLSVGRIDDALKVLEPAYDAKAPDDRVLDLLAAVRMRQKDYARAAELYEIAAKAFPGEQKWWEGLAQVYLLTNDKQKLVGVLEKLAALDSDNLAVRKKLMQLSAEAENWPEVEKWAQETLFVDVADFDAHRLLGETALRQQKFPVAIDEFKTALYVDPGSAEVSVRLAEAYLAAGQRDEAKKQLEAALRIRPGDPKANELRQGLEKP